MEELVIKSTIKVAQMTELSPSEQALINSAIEATNRSYAVYSNFHVGAAVLLKNGKTVIGCNQENVSFGGTHLTSAGTSRLFSGITENERICFL